MGKHPYEGNSPGAGQVAGQRFLLLRGVKGVVGAEQSTSFLVWQGRTIGSSRAKRSRFGKPLCLPFEAPHDPWQCRGVYPAAAARVGPRECNGKNRRRQLPCRPVRSRSAPSRIETCRRRQDRGADRRTGARCEGILGECDRKTVRDQSGVAEFYGAGHATRALAYEPCFCSTMGRGDPTVREHRAVPAARRGGTARTNRIELFHSRRICTLASESGKCSPGRMAEGTRPGE